jgi:hypothetical protein
LGGYILCNFVATGTNQSFTNTAAGYGYQLNGLLVESMPSNMPAMFATVSINGSNISFTGANGPANEVYRVLTSTNLAVPLSMWTPVMTYSFNAAGAFSNNIPINTGQSARFYRLIQPSPQ